MHSVSGWIGSILLGLCGVPQAYRSFKEGHSDGLSTTSILMWTFGELFVTYAVFTDTHSPYLLFNYGLNIFLLLVMCRYKFFPRRSFPNKANAQLINLMAYKAGKTN